MWTPGKPSISPRIETNQQFARTAPDCQRALGKPRRRRGRPYSRATPSLRCAPTGVLILIVADLSSCLSPGNHLPVVCDCTGDGVLVRPSEALFNECQLASIVAVHVLNCHPHGDVVGLPRQVPVRQPCETSPAGACHWLQRITGSAISARSPNIRARAARANGCRVDLRLATSEERGTSREHPRSC